MKRLRRPLVLALLIAVGILMIAPAAASSRAAGRAPLLLARANGIPDRYIVVLRPGQNPRSLAASAGIAPSYVYDAALNGFAATLSAGQLNALRRSPAVAYVEQDRIATIDAAQPSQPRVSPAVGASEQAGGVTINTTQTGTPWHLDRIDQRNRPLSNSYSYTATGAGVYAYIIDTGIATFHPDFGGRAAVAYDALGGNGLDCNGHGTYIAGLVSGNIYGVVKRANLRAVRVLDCNGLGTISDIIAGVNSVTANHANPAVATLALSTSFSSALNSAVTAMSNSGVFTAVQAGDANADACNYSPASASGAVTAGASDINDQRAPFSNYGACVDLYAPGVNVTSDWIGGGTKTLSTTGASCALVAGVGALYLATFPNATSSTVASWIISNATPNVIGGNPAGTPNRLLYKSTL